MHTHIGGGGEVMWLYRVHPSTFLWYRPDIKSCINLWADPRSVDLFRLPSSSGVVVNRELSIRCPFVSKYGIFKISKRYYLTGLLLKSKKYSSGIRYTVRKHYELGTCNTSHTTVYHRLQPCRRVCSPCWSLLHSSTDEIDLSIWPAPTAVTYILSSATRHRYDCWQRHYFVS